MLFVRSLLIWAWLVAGCDQVFDIDEIQPEVVIDASAFDPIVLDTTGWPMNGNVDPTPCPTDGRDEDGDMRLDACDNCPADANDTQADRDRDGIGDICDPHPEFAVERLAAFLPFNDPLNPGGAPIPTQGTWVIENGMLRQRGLTTGRTLWLLAGMWKRPTVEVKLGNWNPTVVLPSTWYVGSALIDDAVVTKVFPDNMVSCRAKLGTNNGELQMVRNRIDTAPVQTSTAFQQHNPIATLAQTSSRHGAPPQCDGERVDAPFPTLTHLVLGVDSGDAVYPIVGMWTFGARADFYSIVVYETIYE